MAFLDPLGSLLISLLKTVVIPLIFFSLVGGASGLPIKKFGRLGLYVILFYLTTSLIAALLGTIIASVLKPDMCIDSASSMQLLSSVESMRSGIDSQGGLGGTLSNLLNIAFMNPFQALSEGKFLPVIVCAIVFGLAARMILETAHHSKDAEQIEKVLGVFHGMQKIVFKITSWMMYYFPIGIFSLTCVNFAAYGMDLFGSYARIVSVVVLGIGIMMLFVYPLIIYFICKENPYKILLKLKEPIITAFVTRSSAATLPVSLRVAEEDLKIKTEVSGFTLSLGATINMDGVCLHLPVFAFLAANIFGLALGVEQIFLLIISVVFASIGAGGIPGGSIFLLMMVLDILKISPEQSSLVVALALGINPLLDMFETCCNVTGDNVGNYSISKKMGMIEK